MSVGLVLMSNIRADTPLPVLWAWMFITGLGIGPTLSVFTIVVQNAVPMRALGVATSNLTFFRQIGGSVGLALLGTVFGNRLAEELPRQFGPLVPQMVQAGVQPQALQSLGSGGHATDLIRVGSDIGQGILGAVAAVDPASAQALKPFIGQIVAAIQQSFSLAIGTVFLIGAATTIVALGASVFMKQLPLRTTFGPAREGVPTEAAGAAGAGAAGAGAAGAGAADAVPAGKPSGIHGPKGSSRDSQPAVD
jgi:hypothetical protein